MAIAKSNGMKTSVFKHRNPCLFCFWMQVKQSFANESFCGKLFVAEKYENCHYSNYAAFFHGMARAENHPAISDQVSNA